MGSPDKRAFSSAKHRHGEWNTRISNTKNVFLRLVWNLISFKRRGVDNVGKVASENSLILDLGSGNGAYAYWLLGRKKCIIVTLDWSFDALRDCRNMFRVCADMTTLPFKQNVFDHLYSIDALGHVDNPGMVLDEAGRVVKPGGHLFMHSECADYRDRWPDKSLIKLHGKDLLALQDGHFCLRHSHELYREYKKRFLLYSFFSPAGIAGWLLGYPEKYYPVFKKSRWHCAAIITLLFASIKRLPLLGGILRVINAVSNRCELVLGLKGGGSCFAQMKKAE
ncbi:MAG: methyltransferase domain-containing protein [Chitinivibrionales bacterium]|nr:methyltransferase domain-containing protein [Chitinivibrionales bacterium]